MVNHQQKKVLVTGIGTFSSIGKNVTETLQSLIDGRSGVSKMKHLDSIYKEEIPVAEIDMSNTEIGKLTGHPNPQTLTRAAMIGLIGAREALSDAKIDVTDRFKTGLVSSNSVGGMDKTEINYLSYFEENIDPTFLDTHDCGAATEQIADALGIKDYITTISTACSSAANAIMFGARLIRNGVLDRVLVGGADCLTKFTLNGFNTLMILDRHPCRPMDDTREGLNLGEAAGYIVIESENSAKGKHVYCELTGFGNTNDAYHQTASSPEGDGAFYAMQTALNMSGLQSKEIDYINVHGTGTANNDLSEGRAIIRLFGNNNIPRISSTKAYTGHTLAAAGGIEAVFSILSIKHDMIFPNLRFKHPISELAITPVTELIRNAGVNNVLSNSFGFGGNNSTVIFSKVN